MLRKYSAFAVLAVILMISPAVSAVNFSDDVRTAADDVRNAAENFPDEIIIGVMEFTSGTLELNPDQAIVVGNVFTQRLAMSVPDNITVIGHGQLSRIAEENHLSTEGYVSNRNAARIGQLAGCRYIIAGTVTDLKKRRASTAVTFVLRLGRTVDVATSAADIRLIDTQTGKTVLSMADSARATQKDSGFSITTLNASQSSPVGYNTPSLPGRLARELPRDLPPVGLDFSHSDLNGMEATSIFLLSSRLSQRVIEAVTGEHPQVLSATSKEVTISAGSDRGARKGMLYMIYADTEDERRNIAVVQIKDVQPGKSKAALYSNGYGRLSLVKPGDRVFPTDIYEAKALIKGKTFIRKRDDMEKKSKSSAAKAKRTKTKRERKIEPITQGND